MTPAQVVLKAEQVCAGYQGREVLHELSLEVRAGELLAIVGPNGAGKSTLMRVLGGGLSASAGTIELLSRPLKSLSANQRARQVASLGQETTVAFDFTVLEVVLMGRSPYLGALELERAHDLRVAHQALAHFDLLALATRPISQLSGGERRRVFLARALAQEPALALLDEPTTFLDLKHAAEIFHLLERLRRERALAVVASLHDLNAAALYADRVMLLKAGRAIACGPPAAVLTAANLRLVYEIPVFVGTHPATGGLAILPLRGVPS